MTFAEQITAHAAEVHGEKPVDTPQTTEMVTETPSTTSEPGTQTDTPSVIEGNQPQEQVIDTPTTNVETPTQAPIDYNSILEEISGGEFKDIDSFKGSLSKFKEYDAVLKEKQDLEAKLNGTIVPANDYLKKLNELHMNGATADQIKSFQRLNDIGDLSKVSPTDIKVHKMVQDGWSEEMARKAVDQEFPLSDYDEDSDEYKILNEKLRISSERDKLDLQKQMVELSTLGEDKIKQEEQEKLNAIAAETQYKNEVKAIIPKITENLKGLGEINLNGEEGDKALKLNFNYNEEFKKDIPKLIELYFDSNKSPITEESLKQASQYVENVYWGVNRQHILETAVKHAVSATTEQIQKKYENRSGLPSETPRTLTTGDIQSEKAAFLERIANRGN